MWLALDRQGLLLSVHQTSDISDGMCSEMFSISHKYLGVVDDVPVRIAKHVKELGGYIAMINFVTPLKFPKISDSLWEALKYPAKWDCLNGFQARILRLLCFIAYDYYDLKKSGLEKLAEAGRLNSFVNDYKMIVKKNGGYINVKCAFQMITKSKEVADKLDNIAVKLHMELPCYLKEMNLIMKNSKI